MYIQGDLDMSDNNSGWEVKDDKVKIGAEWKSAKELKRNSIIEICLAVLSVALCVYGYMVNVVFGIVTMLITLFFILVAMGSLSALRALKGEAEQEEVVTVEKVPLSKRIKDRFQMMKEAASKKVSRKVPVGEPLFETMLTRTANKSRQEVIETIKVGHMLHVLDNTLIQTEKGAEVGELSKVNGAKLEEYEATVEGCKGFRCKVTNIEKNDNEKLVVKVEVVAVK